MNKHLFLLGIALCFFISVKAKTGDTTIVQAHYNTEMPYYGNYDTAILFPNGTKSYRKIYMTFTLGKYHCPAGSTYCGDWDYTVQTFLMNSKGDTLELGRLITPYANAGNPSTPWAWTQRYYFDVTDFYPLLKDSGTIRILYSGYSGGFTANVKFTYIEGTPERNVVGITRLWHGSYAYGNSSDPISNHFPTLSETAPSGTKSAEMKFTVTGHGHDDSACSEFCQKYYQVLLNSTVTDTKSIWRDNCGSNELYPQSGTWIYQRGNWCPGALVNTNIHPLSGITSGTNYQIGLKFQPYTGSVTVSGNSGASYTTEGILFYYGDFNNTLDASLEDVIAPTNYEGYKRENPLCGTPTVKIRNSGSTTITSVQIQYGVTPSYTTFTWNGSLAPLQDTEITLPEPWHLREVSGKSGLYNFMAKIISVNGTTDNDTSNNTLNTAFLSAPTFYPKMYIGLTTNEETLADGITSEFDWKIYDLNGNLVAKRINCAPSSSYRDTVVLGPSCYKLVVEAQNCDGLDGINAPYVGTGSFSLKQATASFPTNLAEYYAGDFGCGFTQYFTTSWPLGVENLSGQDGQAEITAYPNPARTNITISFSGLQNVNGTLRLIDALGRVALEKQCTNAQETINISQLANGLYTVSYIDKSNTNAKLVTRIVVAK